MSQFSSCLTCLDTLTTWLGQKKSALNWSSSHVAHRASKVTMEEADLSFGVLQGSVLGQVLFSLYLRHTSHQFGHARHFITVSCQCYADLLKP